MLETQIWSLSASCRRLVEETEALKGLLDPDADNQVREVGRLLAQANDLLHGTLEQLKTSQAAAEPAAETRTVIELTRRILREDPPAEAEPAPPAPKLDLEAAPTPMHRRAMHSQSFFLPSSELVAFLCGGRKTGVLQILTEDEAFTIELQKGDIVHAHSDGAPRDDRLGAILIERGVLQREELDSLLQLNTSDPLGARAIAQDLASRAELREALQDQIGRLFQRLFQARPKSFAFWEGPCVHAEEDLRLNSTMLLLDGARSADEQGRAAQQAAQAAQAAPQSTPTA